MRVFDNYLGNWIQIIDNKNEITIEKYRFDTGIIEGTTDNLRRSTVLRTWTYRNRYCTGI